MNKAKQLQVLRFCLFLHFHCEHALSAPLNILSQPVWLAGAEFWLGVAQFWVNLQIASILQFIQSTIYNLSDVQVSYEL